MVDYRIRDDTAKWVAATYKSFGYFHIQFLWYGVAVPYNPDNFHRKLTGNILLTTDSSRRRIEQLSEAAWVNVWFVDDADH